MMDAGLIAALKFWLKYPVVEKPSSVLSVGLIGDVASNGRFIVPSALPLKNNEFGYGNAPAAST